LLIEKKKKKKKSVFINHAKTKNMPIKERESAMKKKEYPFTYSL